ncbi:hypothetical protein DPEC_G00109050 [Dallia pectoralis]|uniref:Uncharacterized protein n=1 Tax=Dallia pectoralis TaxID=75939 RepID=A0ACC2GSQ3_DALPE|nr:hypothetical protein DPEC_G00109050 [Dallia pectoralis]
MIFTGPQPYPSLHNSLAASKSVAERYSLDGRFIKEVQPFTGGETRETKGGQPGGLKPKEERLKPADQVSSKLWVPPTGTVNVERQEVPPISKLVQEEQVVSSTSLLTKAEAPRQSPWPENLKARPG